MSGLVWVLVAIAVVCVLAAAIAGAVRKSRTRRLRGRFGPEYDRTLEGASSKKEAEAELGRRADRRDGFQVRAIPTEERRLYAEQWQEIQARFVDAPADSVQEADVLVTRVMREAGYPVESFDDRSEFVSVDHPHLVEDYRQAHRIAVADTGGKVTTEDRRQGMVHFRSLFEALLGDDVRSATRASAVDGGGDDRSDATESAGSIDSGRSAI
jgi:hypothetical protein